MGLERVVDPMLGETSPSNSRITVFPGGEWWAMLPLPKVATTGPVQPTARTERASSVPSHIHDLGLAALERRQSEGRVARPALHGSCVGATFSPSTVAGRPIESIGSTCSATGSPITWSTAIAAMPRRPPFIVTSRTWCAIPGRLRPAR